MARFSVVVPAYNAQSTLAETLDAVLAQTFADWECVVVDDGSADGTKAVAEDYAARDNRFRVISQQNQGSAGAYNTGVRAATGDFVVLCSADDVLLPAHLQTMSTFIEDEPAYDIYSSNGYYWLAEDDSRRLVYPEGVRDEVMSLSLADVIELCFYSVGAAYRRKWFDVVGGYRLGIFGEDYDFWLRAMAAGARHRYLPAALSLHRLSPEQKSADYERAYRSDIGIIEDLLASGKLNADESQAAEESIATRWRLIERYRRSDTGNAIRKAVWNMGSFVLGDRTWRVVVETLRGGRREHDG